MARSLFRDTVVFRGPAGLIPLAGARVWFYEPNGGVTPGPPINYPLYPDAHSTETIPLPYVTGALGELEVWADLPHRAQIVAVKAGLAPVTETIDLEYPPELQATTDDVAQAILLHEGKDDPHQQYLLESEADLLYLPIDYVPDLSNYWTKLESDARYLQQAQTDLLYEQLARKGVANGYVPLDGAGKIPNQYLPDLAITETFVATTEAEMLALDAQVGDVCVRVDTSENYILATEPATVLDNWQKLATSIATGNVSVVTREEFLPTAATTTVSLEAVPTELLSITRNGVEQSELAGHFTASGVTITFAEAFTGDEPVNVVYEVGSASGGGGGGGMTQEEADLRYLQLTGGTLTGDLTVEMANELVVGDAEDQLHLYYNGIFGKNSGDTQYATALVVTTNGGQLEFGPGTGSRDCFLYRDGPGLFFLQSEVMVEVDVAVGGYFRIGYPNQNAASTGEVRLRYGNTIAWRNSANNGNLLLSVDASGNLTWNGVALGGAPDLSAYYTKTESDARYQLATAHPKITVAETAPSSPATGDLWIW